MAQRVAVFMCVERTGMTMEVRGVLHPAAFLTARTVLVDDEVHAAAAAAAMLRDTMPELSSKAVITVEDQRVLDPSEEDCNMGRAFFPDTPIPKTS